MEKDYKKMWDELRAFIQNTKSEHENNKDDYAALGTLLAGMMMKAFDVVLAQMERLETGTAHCVICGAELKKGEGIVCLKCKAENEEFTDDSLFGGLIYNNKDNS